MSIGSNAQLNNDLVKGFEEGTAKRIVEIYSKQGYLDLESGNLENGFFLLTQAYIYALEAGLTEASFLFKTLKEGGRDM
jgi:hypothetical protein